MSILGEPPAHLCPMPANEAQRLRATRACEILDTPPEPHFDAITRVASALFQMPVALIGLMERDRLWFKSRVGLDLAQLDRNATFCAHALVHVHEVMVVNDLAADARFAQHPLVAAGPRLRFYAGAPLVGEGDVALGTLAVADVRPRAFTDADRKALADLALVVTAALAAHQRNQQLRHLATRDYLTGTANRASFDLALARSAQASAAGDGAFALLTLDLDGFKGINEAHGQGAGDTVLREVAHRLQSMCAPGDTVARVGGNEFAVLLGATNDACGASSVAESLIGRLDLPIVLADGCEVRVNGAIGIACCPDDACEPAALLEMADRAVHRAKAQTHARWAMASEELGVRGAGRARADCPHDPSARDAAEVTPIGLGNLHGAPANERPDGLPDRCGACIDGIAKPFPFSMAFQPIVDVRRRSVFAYEALVRGPEGEGAAAILDKVTARNRYAFDQSCRITAIRLAAELGLQQTGASLSINFIPGAMYEPRNCIRATLSAARRYQFPLDRLIFELTEGEEVTDKDKLRTIFAVYAEQGFQTAIDDFGSGYSGLSLLTEFQPRIIKLDMQLIRDIDRHPARLAIVRGVLAMCRDLGIQVIGEGVETLAEYAVLYDLGVWLFQGYLFARPAYEALPAPHFPEP